MLKALAIALLILFTNWLLSLLIGKIRKFDASMTNAFASSIMFYNSGNFGIPLITLVYSSKPFLINGETPYLDFALTVQVIVLIVQNVSLNTLGVFNATRGTSGSIKTALKKSLSLPAIYFVIAAFIFKFIPYDLTQFPCGLHLIMQKRFDINCTDNFRCSIITYKIQTKIQMFTFRC